MEISFDVGFACRHSPNEAIVVKQFVIDVMKYKSEGKNFHLERTWINITLSGFSKLFPFWSTAQVKGIIDKLVDKGIIIKDYISEDKTDRSLWYAFDKEKQILSYFCKEITDKLELPINEPKTRVNNKEKKPKSYQDVVDFFMSIKSTENRADVFWNFYESNGWKVGRNPMGDWKAAARNWVKRPDMSTHSLGHNQPQQPAKANILSGPKMNRQ